MRIALPVLAATLVLSSPAPALAVTAPPPAPVMMEDDHPAPPRPVDPVCEAAARIYARQASHTAYVWDPWYVYYYESYILENCGIIE
ncbi:hypothetical protein P6144_15205 [Sphingomonas sp. HITSZ_GF]|uniref:hypothetical protein n=1 Tax=Sphingomonas sp. HITSZ_GF TaxID=3037247 RepID=UPI00240E8FC1|nr:hypothetical protein [Sphingomonas sp. HITSZ_GF]MDG2535006.1 hypothetical protein [Sphingomonas sp. HITSZ_GF]